MNNHSVYQLLRRRCAVPLILAAGLALGALSASAANPPKVLPPQSHPHGMSYAEWSAAYWQWLFALPLEGHPGNDNPFDVTDGQYGRVWFLTGPFGEIERDITIPAGTSLFISLINVDASTLEEPPFYAATAEEQLAIANEFASFFTDLSFTVDGKSVENIGDFLVTSPQFSFTAPSPWLFGATGGTGTATGVGYFVMLAPLSVGTHTIEYTAAYKFSEDPADYYLIDVTYNVTVE
jgi:hypothetical protein